MAVEFGDRYSLDPMVSLRPEPFGALAYHFGTRKLIFLRSPDIVAVLRELDNSPSLAGALSECGVDPRRWPSFLRAMQRLADSGMIRRVVDRPGPATASGARSPVGKA